MQDRTGRIFAAGFSILVGGAIALLIADPVPAAVVALIAGVMAGLILGIGRTTPDDAGQTDEIGSHAKADPDRPEAVDILNAIDDPMLVVRRRRVEMANAEARRILGEHIEGADVRLAIRHPAAAERLTGISADDTATGRTKTELVGLGERERRWEMTTAPIKGASRLVRLTDRSEAHASEQMRVDFVANASHELRTPLATILGIVETLQDEEAGSDRATRERFLPIMLDEARRMQGLVDDLISLSRIEAERFSPPRESVSMVAVVEEVRNAARRAMEERGSTLIVENEAADTEVVGDRPQLQQLVQNLVMNAVKYSRPGTPVLVRFADAGADMLAMTIIDQGDGIAPEHLPRLTERFYRVDAGRSRSVGGTGLGLAIVKHIVGRHKGRLEIKSRLGEGTAVSVYLPRPAQEDVTNLS